MRIATYRAFKDMPERLRNALPDIEELRKFIVRRKPSFLLAGNLFAILCMILHLFIGPSPTALLVYPQLHCWPFPNRVVEGGPTTLARVYSNSTDINQNK